MSAAHRPEPGQGDRSFNIDLPGVCLILEGTYPYMTGGVSSWTHQLITHLPEVTFHLYCLIPEKEPGPWAFPRPANVVGVTHLSLGGLTDVLGKEDRSLAPDEEEFLISAIRSFHRSLLKGDPSTFEDLFKSFFLAGLSPELFRTLAAGKKAWSLIQEFYTDQFSHESFIDFFWMWRTTHLPLFSLLSAPLPNARVYHALASGYAGILGVMCKIAYRKPLILTEHGLYTRERKIEIALAQWIGKSQEEDSVLRPIRESVKGFWIRIFEQLGRIVYQYSDHIVTLFEGNRRIQIRDGADPGKTRIIPNGIAIPKKLTEGQDRPVFKKAKTVGFIGRVVPIKDVKTFILACRMVADRLPETRFLVMGPLDHDPEYAKECRMVAEFLHLEEILSFSGSVRMEEALPMLDLIVLTSLSEAQPLVIMEGGVYGIPSIATRVGSCEELIVGRSREDKMLGPGGVTTSVGSPDETASAILRLLQNDALRERMGRAARLRMELFYREEFVYDAYRSLYRQGWD